MDESYDPYNFVLYFNDSRLAKDPRFERLPCLHKGTYADDCLVQRVTQVLDLLNVYKS